MRISDWSSDVCSSDLEAQATIRAMIERRGLLLSDTAPVTTGDVPADNLRVVVTRASAFVPGCPDWSTESSITFNNATPSNYGCATNSNLAAMVADPHALLKGDPDPRNNTKRTKKG